MLDAAFIRDNTEAVKANARNRLATHAEVDRVVELDERRKKIISETQTVQERANQISKQIGPEKDPAKKQEMIAEGKRLREQKAGMEAEVKKVEAELHSALLTIPNMTHPDAPVGGTPADNKVIRRVGEPRTFDFAAKDHIALAEALDLVDFEAGAAVTGNKFYFLKNEAVLLELALVQFAMQKLVARGYVPVITPDLARVEVLEGIGFMPRDPNPETRQVYTVADSDLCLIATAEITLGGMLRDKILDEAKLPLRYVGLSHCFRTEAGAPGRDTTGLYPVHQFTKVEMFAFCTPEQSEALDLCDMEAGASVAGQKFYFLKNEAVLLELALVQYAMTTLVKKGWTPIITPDLAKVDVLEGIGFQPRDPDANTRQVYVVQDMDLCLVGTAEITLGGMHRDQVLDVAKLPLRYVGLSHCFRTEAGAAGRDTRGLFRVHQFTKVEMFAYTTPQQSEAMHLEILAIEEEIFQGLGLPYHVLDTCSGDLGGPAYRKYDLEAWMPGRGKGGEYGEVTSTSNCTDFQARRLGIRYRGKGFKGNRFVHTLNGTAVACTRALVAILENYQQADGSVTVPEVLRPWVGKDRIAR